MTCDRQEVKLEDVTNPLPHNLNFYEDREIQAYDFDQLGLWS